MPIRICRLLGLLSVLLLSNLVFAEPSCLDTFKAGLKNLNISDKQTTVARSSKEISGRLSAYYAQMNHVRDDLERSLGVAMKGLDIPDPGKMQGSEFQKYQELVSGEYASRAAHKDSRFIKADSAAKKLRTDFQFDDSNDYFLRFHKYEKVTLVGDEKKPSAMAFIDGNRIVGYRVNLGGPESALTIFEPNSCETKEVMIERKNENSTAWSYLTPKFCSSESTLNSMVAKLDPADEEFGALCRKQGAQGDAACRCPDGRYINPWAASCFKERILTARDRLYKYIQSTGAVVYENADSIHIALDACKKYRVYGTTGVSPGNPPPPGATDPTRSEQ